MLSVGTYRTLLAPLVDMFMYIRGFLPLRGFCSPMHVDFSPRLFIDEAKVTADVQAHLQIGTDGGVSVFPYTAVASHVTSLEGKVWVSG